MELTSPKCVGHIYNDGNIDYDKVDYKVIEDYRYNACGRPFALHEHQELLSNIINPDTPYKGVLVFHGLGTGKTCVGIAIAEKFKVHHESPQVLVIINGECTYDESHMGISMDEIIEQTA